MKRKISRADTRAEYKRIVGKLEFRSGPAVLKFSLCLAVAALVALLPPFPGLTDAGRYTLGIVLFCGLLWMSEAIPAFAVALLAIGLQIMLLGAPGGVLIAADDPKGWEIFVEPWASPSMWLFFGGFILAKASARTGLDRDLAHRLLALAGKQPERVLLVAMVTTFVFSMFLSNTATAAMMLAILAPMLAKNASPTASRAMIIAVAFAANIGGMGTIIGTPPNAIASGLLENAYPVSFLTWIAFGLPPTIVLLAGLWLALRKRVAGSRFQLSPLSHPYRASGDDGLPHLEDPEEESSEERVPFWQRGMVLVVFGLTVALWLTGTWHGIPTAVVSFVPIVLLSMTGVIRGEDIRTLDWDILILLAGGLSLGVGVSESGLAEWIAERLALLPLASWAMAMVFCLLTFLLSNFMSNTAAANILIPIGIAAGMNAAGSREAAMFAIPMALSASAAMCLPISTPPNALAYATGTISSKHLLLPGLIVGLVAIPLCVLWTRLVATWL